jgi:hypothetical protein
MNRKGFSIIFVLYVVFCAAIKINAQTEPPWAEPEHTGVTQPVYIFEATINGTPIDIDEDWIGIFDNALIVGKGQVDALPAQNNLIAYIEYDPPVGPTLPGATAGNPIMFKIWDKSSNQVLDAAIIEVLSDNAIFGESNIVTVSINALSQNEPDDVDVTINTNPAGLEVLIDGATFTSPVAQTWEIGVPHTLSTDQTQSGGAGVQYSFTQWSSGSARIIVVEATPSNNVFTASFQTSYYLTTAVSPSGAGTISPTSGWYTSGQTVNLSAEPTVGTNYSFTEWSGDLTGNQNPAPLPMDSPKTVTANFEQVAPVNVEVTTVPPGLGITVDGNSYISPRTFSWQTGSRHEIGVDPIYPGATGTRRVFVRWSDNGRLTHEVIVPTTDISYQSEFALECELTTQNLPAIGGSIIRTPDKAWYEEGERVELSAQANTASNYSFLNWSGEASGSSNPVFVYMNGAKQVNANYIQLSGSDVIVRFPSDLHGAPGDTVEIPVNILSDVTGMGILSYQLAINFNQNVLLPLGVDATGTMTESWQAPVFNDQTAGQIQVGGYHINELTGSGALVKLLFIVTGAQGSQTTLQFAECIFNSGTPLANTEPGLFNVEREQPDILGSVFYHSATVPPIQSPVQYVSMNGNNGLFVDLTKADGSYAFIDVPIGADFTVKPTMPRFAHLTPGCIQTADASLTAFSVFGLENLTDLQKRAADVDKDGGVFMYDAAQILYYAVFNNPIAADSYVGEWVFKPESMVYPNLSTDKINQNYEAIVLGDVNADLPNPGSLSKQGVNRITLANLTVAEDEEIKVDLNFVDSASFLVLYFNLTYDAEAFELKSISKSMQAQQFELFQNSQQGSLTLGMLAPRPTKISDEIVTLTFTSKSEGDFELTFDEFMLNMDDPVQYAQRVLIGNKAVATITSFHLFQNYPNPFNPTTTISYTLPLEEPEYIGVHIYDLKGRLVKKIFEGIQGTGEYQFQWDGTSINNSQVASGLYFCSIFSSSEKRSIKILKAK